MTGFTIFCFILLTVSSYSFYSIVRRIEPIKKHFYLKQILWQLAVFIFSLLSIYLLALAGTGHHVDTDLENILEEVCMYILLITLPLSLIGLITGIIKKIKHK